MDRKYNSTIFASGRRPSASGSVSSDGVEGKTSTDVGGVTVYQRDRVSTEDDKMMMQIGDANSEDTIFHVSSVSATRSRSNSRMGMGMGNRDRDRDRDRSWERGMQPAGGGGIQMTTQFSITYDDER